MSEAEESNPPPQQLPAVISARVEHARTPSNQLGDLPQEELEAIAEEYGIEPGQFRSKAALVSAIHERRQLIATLARQSMQEVLDWAGRSLPPTVSPEQMAIEIAHIRSMRFNGLSDRGLVVLAMMRGCDVEGAESRDDIISKLKSQEGFFARIKRKTRGWMGKRVERMVGDSTTEIPAPTPEPHNKSTDQTAVPRQQALREEIEDAGFFSGIANRVKKQADSYVNQKLDEIEARIDRKLDEIDRRLAEWRDKEIANRIRILKITLWASVVVAAVSLIYSYVNVVRDQWNQPKNLAPSTTPTSIVVPARTTSATAAAIEIPTSRSSAN
ncbi:MAG: hypothetical protein H7144_15035 [Burkholderiales bacterium]|nr:hypothetical protein [Phycisphaerae bacterium]